MGSWHYYFYEFFYGYFYEYYSPLATRQGTDLMNQMDLMNDVSDEEEDDAIG